MASHRKREAVRVVLIDTQYVVTDPMSFKYVVQSLTGKDSCVSWIEESSYAGTNGKKPEEIRNGGVHLEGSGSERFGGSVNGSTFNNSTNELRLSRDFSFKDLDRMTLELPTMEEWTDLWASVKND